MATTDEYFPATNAFLRSLTEPEPAPRPPSTRGESAAASVNWRVADATERRAATDRAERAFSGLGEEGAKGQQGPKGQESQGADPGAAGARREPAHARNRHFWSNLSLYPDADAQKLSGEADVHATTGSSRRCCWLFERAGWMCCVEDNRTSTRPHGKKHFQDALSLIPVQRRGRCPFIQREGPGRTTDNDGLVADAEDAEGRDFTVGTRPCMTTSSRRSCCWSTAART